MRFQMLSVILLAGTLGACGGGDDGREPAPQPAPAPAPGPAPGPAPAPAPGGGSSCSEVIDCLNTCTDDTCSNECVGSASTAAQQAILDLASCIQEHQCTDEACLQAQCGTELSACLGDGQ